MDNATRIERMKALLADELAPASMQIEDQSHLHAGHAGAREGKGHFQLDIVADAFAGKLPLARHRLVYAALGDMMQTDIHALIINAKAPEETS